MARIDIRLGNPDEFRADVLPGTPRDLLPADAILWIGQVCLQGSPAAMRRLAETAREAADAAAEARSQADSAGAADG